MFAVLIGGIFFMPKAHKNSTTSGIVVILSGPSTAGKTSIQKAFQNIASELWLKIGLDNFFCEVFPPTYMGKEERAPQLPSDKEVMWITHETDEHGNNVVPIHFGPLGIKVMMGMFSAIGAYARAGNNLIVDFIPYDIAWIQCLKNDLQEIKTYWIDITLPLEVAEAREKERKTSPIGHARSHHHKMPHTSTYDLVIDTSRVNPEEAAHTIYDFIKNHPKSS